MPYIPNSDRAALNSDERFPVTPGELNYVITRAVHDYLHRRGVSYAVYNELIGVLECTKLELYRRLVAPYEDQKIKQNGDVP